MEKNHVFEWIKKIIETCNNDFHFEAVDKLIELFNDKFNDEDSLIELRLMKEQKWNDIHGILK